MTAENMIIEYVADLPDCDAPFEPHWARWQIHCIRLMVNAACGEPYSLLIDGCVSERSEDWPTVPSDHHCPDGLAVFYGDGDEELAQQWSEVCREAVVMLEEAVDWQAIRPSGVVKQSARMGRQIRPVFVKRPPPPGVLCPREQLDAIEEAKCDVCEIDLVRRPPVIHEFDSVFGRLMLSYVDLIVGLPPEDVSLRWLWVPSHRWRSDKTGKPTKVVAGWGLDCGPEDRQKALEYAEPWRLAFYTLAGAAEWDVLLSDRLKQTALDVGIIEKPDGTC